MPFKFMFHPDVSRYLQYSAQFMAMGTALLLVLGARLPRWWTWGAALFGLGVFVAWAAAMDEKGNDLFIFWDAGRTILDGRSPYTNELFLNPPNTLWFFGALGFVDFWFLRGLFLVFNILFYSSLAFLAWDVARGQDRLWDLGVDAVGVCAALLALSLPARYGVALGQLSGLVAAALIGSLWFQARGYPILAGLCLLVGQIKIGSMLPFLLLFLRPSDLRTWITLIVGGLLLTLVGAYPGEWIDLSKECLNNIKALSQPGKVNDISFANPVSKEVLGPDHLLYRLGIWDPMLLQFGQLALLLGLGTWLTWLILSRPSWSRAALCAMAACYSDIFLYHRFYSTIILALPLVYALGRARENGPGAWLYRLVFLACAGVLYMRVEWLGTMTDRYGPGTDMVSRLVQAVVLPYPTWLILAALVGLAVAEGKRCRWKSNNPEFPLA